MSKHPNSLSAKKGTSTGIKVSVDKSKWTSLVDGAVNLVLGNFLGAGKSLLDIVKGVKFGKGIEGKALELIFNALFIALDNILTDFEDRTYEKLTVIENPFESDAYKNLVDGILQDFENAEIILTPEFTSKPQNLAFLEDLKPQLIDFFKLFDIHPNDCLSLSESLNFYFLLAVNQEARNEKYNTVFKHLDSSFNEEIERELNWQRYHESLVFDTKKRIFGEDFRIIDLYIPLRAYYKKPIKEKKSTISLASRAFEMKNKSNNKIEYTYHAFDLEDYLDKWLARPKSKNIEDYFILISGEPGAGKSTVTKMWAARVGQQNKFKVLYIPLGGGFSFNDDVNTAVNDFVASQQFIGGECDLFKNINEPTLVIFDGLDELNKQGRDAVEQARFFITELKSKIIQLINSQKELLKIIISGREIAVQQCEDIINKSATYLHLLPYIITPETFWGDVEKEKEDYFDIKFSEMCMAFPYILINQRVDWWENYISKHNEFKGRERNIPLRIKEGELEDITAQPLLNFLLSLSWEGGNVNFDRELNLNNLYSDLLKQVHARDCKKMVKSVAEQFDIESFKTIMQQIGLAAWQNGDARSLKAQHLDDYVQKSGLNRLLDEFKSNNKKNASRLFIAFYFKQNQSGISENVFYEFTHKSFGEYLTATGILELVKHTHEMLNFDEEEVQWDKKTALKTWVNLTARENLDEYIIAFIQREVDLIDKETLKEWQQSLTKLVNEYLRRWIPVHQSDYKDIDTHTATIYARNTAETLWILAVVISKQIGNTFNPHWQTRHCFANLVNKIHYGKSYYTDYLFSRFNNNVNLTLESKCNEPSYMEYDEKGSLPLNYFNFACSEMRGIVMKSANLKGVDLDNVNLEFAKLSGANLSGANLCMVNLSEANLNGANLSGANLKKAELGKANLKKVDLRHANLERADLRKAILDSADLRYTILFYVNLRESDLSKSDLREADLWKANLRGAKLVSADLNFTNLNHTLVDCTWFAKLEKERIAAVDVIRVKYDLMEERGGHFLQLKDT